MLCPELIIDFSEVSKIIKIQIFENPKRLKYSRWGLVEWIVSVWFYWKAADNTEISCQENVYKKINRLLRYSLK